MLEGIRSDENAWAVDNSIRNVHEIQQYGRIIAGQQYSNYDIRGLRGYWCTHPLCGICVQKSFPANGP